MAVERTYLGSLSNDLIRWSSKQVHELSYALTQQLRAGRTGAKRALRKGTPEQSSYRFSADYLGLSLGIMKTQGPQVEPWLLPGL